MGGGGGPPAPPPFNPIKIGPLANRALGADIARYKDMGFPVFPGLAAVRQKEIEDAYKQMTGPLNPEFQQDFMRQATIGVQGAVGGGDPFSGMGYGKGSFAKGAQTAGFTRETLAKQDYDRARFESLLQANPVPQLGLSQNDLASLFIYNTGAQNAFSMSNYANKVAGANADYANQVNTYNTIGNTISGLGSIYSNYASFNGFGGDGAASLGSSFGGGV